jgi:hypothetical protein
MSRYLMEDGAVVETKSATADWREATHWNGNNHISVATGSQWVHERLYRSRKGRYYIEHTSQWQGSSPSANWVSREEAARWLLTNDHPLPADLADLEAEVME